MKFYKSDIIQFEKLEYYYQVKYRSSEYYRLTDNGKYKFTHSFVESKFYLVTDIFRI